MTLQIIEILLTNLVVITLCISILLSYITIFFFKKYQHFLYYDKLSILSFILISLLLCIRWILYNHFPLTNLYESCIFLSWSINFYSIIVSKKHETYWLNTILAPSILCTFIFPIISIPHEMQNSNNLVPALQSSWLIMHVTMMILSYGLLLCGSLLAITILTLIYDHKKFMILNYNIQYDHTLSLEDTLNNLFANNLNIEQYIFFIKKYILVDKLDHWSYKSISIGFIFLTIGILSGAVWANEAWGSYWSWDPKETWAFITWLIFAIYLHTRIVMEWKRESSALIALIGFFLIWICYLGVNILGKGFHSYGWFR